MKYTIDTIKEAFEKEGYTLLSTEYTNNKQHLDYICPEGHKHHIPWSDWNNQHARCPYCNGRPIYTQSEVYEAFKKEGYTLLTPNYINNKQKLEYLCPKGHKYTICYSSWLQGRRCFLCNGNVKKSIEEIKSSFYAEGYTLLSTMYTGCQEHLEVVCPKGHTYRVTWDNWNSKGSRCPACSTGVSEAEKELYVFIKDFYSGVVIQRDRDICKPKELDIIIPEKKIAIEYCGLYWHSELAGKDKNYHVNKLKSCLKEGYRLITVFEDEWETKRDIVKSRLQSIIGNSDVIKLFARKCNIIELTTTEARLFCQENHLQGYGSGSAIKLGLFHNKILVAVMIFSKSSLSEGQKHNKEGVWELHRFCTKLGYQVLGGASKLLKYFEHNYSWSVLSSYADKRWSDGSLYYKLNFSFVEDTPPDCWYVSRFIRRHGFSLPKTRNEADCVKQGLHKVQGYNRIWDCGSIKFIKYVN